MAGGGLPERVCVFGAGAIGGILAARLAAVPDVRLSVVARGAQLRAIRERGLRIERDGSERLVQLRATDDPASLGEQDVVFNCLKAHQAWESAEGFASLLGATTAWVTCQNGLPWWYFHALGSPFGEPTLESVDRDGRQWRLIGPERAVGCCLYPAAEVPEPGVVRHLFGDGFWLGEPNGETTERVSRISNLLTAAGLEAPVLADIRSELWIKLWGNLCFNPISALTGATLDVMAIDPGTRAIAREMMVEAQAVGERFGATFSIDVDARLERAKSVGAHRTSTLQDLDAGKAMEIDALVTVVQELGRIAGIGTPCIDLVLGLVQQLGRTRGLYPAVPPD